MNQPQYIEIPKKNRMKYILNLLIMCKELGYKWNNNSEINIEENIRDNRDLFQSHNLLWMYSYKEEGTNIPKKVIALGHNPPLSKPNLIKYTTFRNQYKAYIEKNPLTNYEYTIGDIIRIDILKHNKPNEKYYYEIESTTTRECTKKKTLTGILYIFTEKVLIVKPQTKFKEEDIDLKEAYIKTIEDSNLNYKIQEGTIVPTGLILKYKSNEFKYKHIEEIRNRSLFKFSSDEIEIIGYKKEGGECIFYNSKYNFQTNCEFYKEIGEKRVLILFNSGIKFKLDYITEIDKEDTVVYDIEQKTLSITRDRPKQER